MEEEIQKLLRDIADRLITFYKDRAPVDTGALKNSIRAEVRGSGEIAVIYNRYGAYQDLGVNGVERSYGAPFNYTNSVNRFGNLNPVGGGLPWGARVNIRKFGLKPQYWLSNPDGTPLLPPDAVQMLEDGIAVALEELVTSTTQRTAL